MDWLAGYRADGAADPRALWPEVRSIVMLGMNYGPDERSARHCSASRDRGAISVYAQNRDYHDVVKGKLKADRRQDRRAAPASTSRCSSTPRRSWKSRWPRPPGSAGRASTPIWSAASFGSWLFLGSIFTTAELAAGPRRRQTIAAPAAPVSTSARPTAFPAPYRLDARRCISYLTIENKGPIPREFRAGDRQPHLWLRRLPRRLPLEQVRAAAHRRRSSSPATTCEAPPLDRPAPARRRAASGRCFRGSPVKRIGRDRFLRNVLIAAGNSGDAALLPRMPGADSSTRRRWCAARPSGRCRGSVRVPPTRCRRCGAGDDGVAVRVPERNRARSNAAWRTGATT